jgi:hypothetical protein
MWAIKKIQHRILETLGEAASDEGEGRELEPAK